MYRLILALLLICSTAFGQTQPVQSTTRQTVTSAEIARINAALTAGDQATADRAALTVQLATAQAQVATLTAEVARLQALLAAIPPVGPPVVVPPPVNTGRVRLYVDGNKLRTKNGTAFQVRGIEHMYGVDEFNVGPAQIVDRLKALGANSVGPLFQGANGSVARVKAYLDAARAAGLVVGVNGDHQTGGRAWLTDPAMVTLLNGYDHVFLQLEVETDSVNSDAQWVTGATSLVTVLRTAGHKSVIKVGAPQGGRRVEYALRAGAQVLAADPERQLIFTWQAYWGEATSSTWYQSQAGKVGGLQGTLSAIDDVAASPLCFLIGFDWQDDIGTTGELTLMDRAHARGLNYQHWVLAGDGTLVGNNLLDRFDWTRSLTSITPNGLLIQAKLLSQRVMAVF
jgi:uncharacterized protein YndB with AHSA1/START domain